MKKIALFIISTFIFINLVSAKCTNSDIAKLKKYANNINLSYNFYYDLNNPMFSITVNNIIPDIYIVDSRDDIKYTYLNTSNGEITIYNYRPNYDSGKYTIYSNTNECVGYKVGVKYYKFPKYNFYYDTKYCEGYKNLKICNRFYDTSNYTSDQVKKIIEDYNKEDNKEDEIKYVNKSFLDTIIEFYVHNYIILLVSIITICLLIIFIERKRDKFKL